MNNKHLVGDLSIYQRDVFLYRILSGKLKYRELEIRTPTIEILCEASEVYKKFFERAVDEGIMTEQDTINALCEEQKWDTDKEKMLNEDLPKQIEHWKEEIYLAYFNTDKRNTVRKYLQTAKDEFIRLSDIRHSYDHMSCAGVANYAKLQFLIEKCVFKNNKLYKWTKYTPYQLMSFQQENVIREEYIREISHNQPWHIMWQSGKKIGNVFGKPAIELSFDQQRLVMWSILYDNVGEHTDSPNQDIINDDDALDGWLSIKRKERGEESFKGGNEKINNAQEVYIPVSTKEDADKVDRLNSQFAKSLKKQRFNAIDKAGELREQDLPDIKQEVMMEYNRRYKDG